MNKEGYNNKIIEDAVEILNDDGVIIVPTDTVYGLAVKCDSKKAIEKIYEIKKRNLNKQLPIVVDTYERLLSICDVEINEIKKLNKFFPGKLTIILKKKNSEETVAVRMINSEIINKIIEKLNCALMLTSANVSSKEPIDDISNLIEEFDSKVDMIVMGSKVGKVSSTIVEFKENKIVLVREGCIPFKDIEEAYYRG